MIRILVTGSRDLCGQAEIIVPAALQRAISEVPWERDIVIVHGAHRGVDTIAGFWAIAGGLKHERHLADWTTYGKAAGPRRNRAMVALGAQLCLAFPRGGPARGSGTWDCIGAAAEAGIPVRIYPLPKLRATS